MTEERGRIQVENYMVFLWAGIIFAALIVEGMTAELVALWFIPAAIVCLPLAILDVPIWIQAIVFLVLVVFCLVFARAALKNRLQNKPPERTNADALLGRTAVVTEDIDNETEQGAVRVSGLVWSARAVEDGMKFAVGDAVIVYRIDGVKLIVIPKKD